MFPLFNTTISLNLTIYYFRLVKDIVHKTVFFTQRFNHTICSIKYLGENNEKNACIICWAW